MARRSTKRSPGQEGKKKEQQFTKKREKEQDKNDRKKDQDKENEQSNAKVPKPPKSKPQVSTVMKARHVLETVLPYTLRRFDPAFIGVLCTLFVYLLHLFGLLGWVFSWLPLVHSIPLIAAVSGLVRFGAEYFLAMKNLPSERKAVLVTGCDSGFGLVLCKRLVATGFSVFAACSNLDGDGAKDLRGHHSKKIRVLEMDVTSDESVDAAALCVRRFLDQSATEDHGPFGKNLRLWSVITNAGVGLLAPLEVTPMAEIENLFKVNVIGVIRTVKAFLPLLRRSNGRVIVTSSLAGSHPMPNLVAYSMTKTAVKAFAIGLQRELRPFKIKCITIEPFFYRTKLMINSDHSPASRMAVVEDSDQRATYAAFIEEWEQQRRTMQSSGDDMEAPMRAFGHALCSIRPKRCYSVMSIPLRVLLCLAPHFDLSYMDFMVAFNRSPTQAIYDLIDLEDQTVRDHPDKISKSKGKVPKMKSANSPSTDSRRSPQYVQPSSSSDSSSTPTSSKKPDPKSGEQRRQHAEDSRGSKHQHEASRRDKKKQ